MIKKLICCGCVIYNSYGTSPTQSEHLKIEIDGGQTRFFSKSSSSDFFENIFNHDDGEGLRFALRFDLKGRNSQYKTETYSTAPQNKSQSFINSTSLKFETIINNLSEQSKFDYELFVHREGLPKWFTMSHMFSWNKNDHFFTSKHTIKPLIDLKNVYFYAWGVPTDWIECGQGFLKPWNNSDQCIYGKSAQNMTVFYSKKPSSTIIDMDLGTKKMSSFKKDDQTAGNGLYVCWNLGDLKANEKTKQTLLFGRIPTLNVNDNFLSYIPYPLITKIDYPTPGSYGYNQELAIKIHFNQPMTFQEFSSDVSCQQLSQELSFVLGQLRSHIFSESFFKILEVPASNELLNDIKIIFPTGVHSLLKQTDVVGILKYGYLQDVVSLKPYITNLCGSLGISIDTVINAILNLHHHIDDQTFVLLLGNTESAKLFHRILGKVFAVKKKGTDTSIFFPFDISGRMKKFQYASGDQTKRFILNYVIQSDDHDINGIQLMDSKIHVCGGLLKGLLPPYQKLKNTNIEDSLDSFSKIIVSGIRPIITSIEQDSLDEHYSKGRSVSWTVFFDKPVKIKGNPSALMLKGHTMNGNGFYYGANYNQTSSLFVTDRLFNFNLGLLSANVFQKSIKIQYTVQNFDDVTGIRFLSPIEGLSDTIQIVDEFLNPIHSHFDEWVFDRIILNGVPNGIDQVRCLTPTMTNPLSSRYFEFTFKNPISILNSPATFGILTLYDESQTLIPATNTFVEQSSPNSLIYKSTGGNPGSRLSYYLLSNNSVTSLPGYNPCDVMISPVALSDPLTLDSPVILNIYSDPPQGTYVYPGSKVRFYIDATPNLPLHFIGSPLLELGLGDVTSVNAFANFEQLTKGTGSTIDDDTAVFYYDVTDEDPNGSMSVINLAGTGYAGNSMQNLPLLALTKGPSIMGSLFNQYSYHPTYSLKSISMTIGLESDWPMASNLTQANAANLKNNNMWDYYIFGPDSNKAISGYPKTTGSSPATLYFIATFLGSSNSGFEMLINSQNEADLSQVKFPFMIGDERKMASLTTSAIPNLTLNGENYNDNSNATAATVNSTTTVGWTQLGSSYLSNTTHVKRLDVDALSMVNAYDMVFSYELTQGDEGYVSLISSMIDLNNLVLSWRDDSTINPSLNPKIIPDIDLNNCLCLMPTVVETTTAVGIDQNGMPVYVGQHDLFKKNKFDGKVVTTCRIDGVLSKANLMSNLGLQDAYSPLDTLSYRLDFTKKLTTTSHIQLALNLLGSSSTTIQIVSSSNMTNSNRMTISKSLSILSGDFPSSSCDQVLNVSSGAFMDSNSRMLCPWKGTTVAIHPGVFKPFSVFSSAPCMLNGGTLNRQTNDTTDMILCEIPMSRPVVAVGDSLLPLQIGSYTCFATLMQPLANNLNHPSDRLVFQYMVQDDDDGIVRINPNTKLLTGTGPIAVPPYIMDKAKNIMTNLNIGELSGNIEIMKKIS
jgi:hypothetical protein